MESPFEDSDESMMSIIRLRVIMTFIGLIFISLFYRSYQLTFESPLPASFGRKSSKEIRRGTIYDSIGNQLAISKETASVGIRPTELLDVQKTAELIAPILNISSTSIVESVGYHRDKSFFWLKRKVNILVAGRLKKLKISGIHVSIEPSRYYPNKELGSNLIGFVDIDNQGLGGIEFRYNDTLTASFGNSRIGHNIYLTIHSFLQYQLEKHLRETMKKTKSKSAVGIISESDTGRILAMSSLPNFNPENIRDSSSQQRKNRAIDSAYEPGSTFKIFTLAILLENYLLKPTDHFFCPGYIQKKGFKIRCSGVHNKISIQDVIKKSCNTGIIEASFKISTQDFFKGIKKFGFGTPTEISLPGESRGIVRDYSHWDTSIRMSIPIGHGIAITPMQIIAAANSIANGGRLLKVHVVDKIVTADNKLIFQASPTERNKTVKSSTSQMVLKYLVAVTQKGGTGSLANLELSNVEVSGKTGTTIKSDSKGYSKNRYQASFLGFFPAKNPKITMFILFDEPDPNSSHQGGAIAAPVFREILRKNFSLLYSSKSYQVKKMKKFDFEKEESQLLENKMPNLLGRGKKDVLRLINKYYQGEHIIKGSGYVVKQLPKKGEEIKKPYQFIIEFGFLR